MQKYENDVILLFMCGIQKSWEEEILDTRPEVDVRWLGRHVAM